MQGVSDDGKNDNMATAMKQNIPFLKQQAMAFFGNSSVVVKFLCTAVALGYFLSFSSSLLRVFAVIPAYVLPPNFWYWTFLTHSFIELHIWNVIVDIMIVVLYGTLLEPLWGAKEMLLFYIVVTVCVAILSTFFYLILYIVTGKDDFFFETYVCGLASYVGAFTVAVKQIMPDHVLVNSAFGKLRNRHIPLTTLIASIIARIIGMVDGPYPVMFGFGLVVSWVYLRFYQKHTNGNKGDFAESFSFASFFPDGVQPVIGVISNTIFSMLVTVKICKKPQRKYDFSSPTTITVTLPGTDPQDAERRRQLALKALNERLSKVHQAPTEWPSLDQDEDAVTTDSATTTNTGADTGEETGPESTTPDQPSEVNKAAASS